MDGISLILLVAVAAVAQPVVEAEEDVYSYVGPDNGSGPMWCFGSTCLVHTGDRTFASGVEIIEGAKPLNNTRWMLFARDDDGWRLVRKDETDRTREPSPMAAFGSGEVFLSVNPTLTPPDTYNGSAEPRILRIDSANPDAEPSAMLPTWEGAPEFTEHSYRSFAADGESDELILLQNIGYTHAEWAFLDREGAWSAAGKLVWPYGAEYEEPEPIRVCYPSVALRDRAVYFLGVSDIIEPNSAWRAYKKELTGQEWDYDFRRLFYTSCPDIRTGEFGDWVEIASREETCGWISPCDLYAAPNGDVHILWGERAIDERLREKFFPEAKQRHSLEYAVIRDGVVVLRKTIAEGGEGLRSETPGQARFQITADGTILVVYFTSGADEDGQAFQENRLVEIGEGGEVSAPVALPLSHPFSTFFTATTRGGSPPSDTLEMLGESPGVANTIRYARVRVAE